MPIGDVRSVIHQSVTSKSFEITDLISHYNHILKKIAAFSFSHVTSFIHTKTTILFCELNILYLCSFH